MCSSNSMIYIVTSLVLVCLVTVHSAPTHSDTDNQLRDMLEKIRDLGESASRLEQSIDELAAAEQRETADEQRGAGVIPELTAEWIEQYPWKNNAIDGPPETTILDEPEATAERIVQYQSIERGIKTIKPTTVSTSEYPLPQAEDIEQDKRRLKAPPPRPEKSAEDDNYYRSETEEGPQRTLCTARYCPNGQTSVDTENEKIEELLQALRLLRNMQTREQKRDYDIPFP